MSSDLRPLRRTIRLDVAVLADTRSGDVAGPAHAAAVAALAEAGYRVGLLQVASAAIAADPGTRNPHFAQLLADGTVTAIGPGAEIECSLALAFDARIFDGTGSFPVAIRAAHRVVTLERPATLARLPAPDLARLHERVRIALGGPPVWAPTTVIAREALAFAAPHWAVSGEDWPPVAPQGTSGAEAEDRARPVIGRARVSRSRAMAGFPAGIVNEPLVALRVRSGPDRPVATWPTAAPMECWTDDQPLEAFLRNVDILANPDTAEDDPCPVEALVALRAGVVPFLPPGCRDVFAGAALYGTEATLARTAIDYWMDPDLRTSLRNSGADLLTDLFSADHFVERVERLIGPPRDDPFAPVVHACPSARILFYSTNGVGMGHLTRQLAIARRLPTRLEPAFVSHSQAVDVVRGFGYPAEYIPYHAAYGEARSHWNAGLAEALDSALAFYRPNALVFDGNVPFVGLLEAMDRHPEIARLWVRRSLWAAERDDEVLSRARSFDLVVEPGEVAWSRDDGPTTRHSGDTLRVAPVRLLDDDEIPDRNAACESLGLDPGRTNVLIALGSGNNFDLREIVKRAVDRLAGRAGIGVVVAEWRIASELPSLPADVVRLRSYPFALTLNAFDFALAAPGYNTFAEHVAAGLPTIWVPNENPLMDRQIHRATHARDLGMGACLRASEPFRLRQLVDDFLDPAARARMKDRAQREAERLGAANGARDVADAVEALSRSVMVRPSGSPEET